MTRHFEHITTEARVAAYEASNQIFAGLLKEVRELSKKKPEATMSAGKVKIINRVLSDLLEVLTDEPEGKYLEVLDEETLPQLSDAVLIMVQFETAIESFADRYKSWVPEYDGKTWITKELVAQLNEEEDEEDEEEED